MNLATLDLNLLVSLDALLQERSVTRAAQLLNLSQPALSASLARLRRHFNDELLFRVGNDYRLTPLAVQLKARSRIALDSAQRVFSAQPDFEPAESVREFSVLISDYGVAVLGDSLVDLLEQEAPLARMRLTHNTPYAVDRAAETLLSTDVMLLPHGFIIADLPHVDLYRDEWVLVVSADNPDVGAELTVEQLVTMPWVVTYHEPTASTPAARQMRMLGIEPRVQVVTDSFLTVAGLVAGSGRIALLQERLLKRLPLDIGIRSLPCPFEVGPLVEAMWWHPAYQRDPEHLYLRNLVRRAAQLAAGTPA